MGIPKYITSCFHSIGFPSADKSGCMFFCCCSIVFVLVYIFYRVYKLKILCFFAEAVILDDR